MANNIESYQSESATLLPGNSSSAPVQANLQNGNWVKYAAVATVIVIVTYAGATFLGQSNAETGALTDASLKGDVDL
jgi:hypothetical protein